MSRRLVSARVGLSLVLGTLLLAGVSRAGEAEYDEGVVEHRDPKTKFLWHRDKWQSKADAQGFGYSFVPHYHRPMAYHYRPAYHFSSNFGLRAYGWYQGRGGYNYGLPYGYTPAHDRLDYQQYKMDVTNRSESALQPPAEGYPYSATFYRRHCERNGWACCCGCDGIPMAGYPSPKYYSYAQFAGAYCPPGHEGRY